MKLVLDKYRKEPIKYSTQLQDPSSNQYQQLTEATREGLNRMSMQSDLRDIYHGVIVGGFGPAEKNEKAVVSYIIQVIFYCENGPYYFQLTAAFSFVSISYRRTRKTPNCGKRRKNRSEQRTTA